MAVVNTFNINGQVIDVEDKLAHQRIEALQASIGLLNNAILDGGTKADFTPSSLGGISLTPTGTGYSSPIYSFGVHFTIEGYPFYSSNTPYLPTEQDEYIEVAIGTIANTQIAFEQELQDFQVTVAGTRLPKDDFLIRFLAIPQGQDTVLYINIMRAGVDTTYSAGTQRVSFEATGLYLKIGGYFAKMGLEFLG